MGFGSLAHRDEVYWCFPDKEMAGTEGQPGGDVVARRGGFIDRRHLEHRSAAKQQIVEPRERLMRPSVTAFGSRAAVLKTWADHPASFQYASICCTAASRGDVPKAAMPAGY
jgi:hypothetical protein